MTWNSDSTHRAFPCVHAPLLHSRGIKWRDQMTWHLDDSLLCRHYGQFWLFLEETAPRKTAENTAKHRNGGVGSVVANHCGGGETSVVVTTLNARTHLTSTLTMFAARRWHCRFCPPTGSGCGPCCLRLSAPSPLGKSFTYNNNAHWTSGCIYDRAYTKHVSNKPRFRKQNGQWSKYMIEEKLTRTLNRKSNQHITKWLQIPRRRRTDLKK